MTAKDAKNVIVSLVIPNFDEESFFGSYVIDALKMAISALEFRNKYDQFWEEVKTAGMNGKETEIHHSGRVFRIREIAQ